MDKGLCCACFWLIIVTTAAGVIKNKGPEVEEHFHTISEWMSPFILFSKLSDMPFSKNNYHVTDAGHASKTLVKRRHKRIADNYDNYKGENKTSKSKSKRKAKTFYYDEIITNHLDMSNPKGKDIEKSQGDINEDIFSEFLNEHDIPKQTKLIQTFAINKNDNHSNNNKVQQAIKIKKDLKYLKRFLKVGRIKKKLLKIVAETKSIQDLVKQNVPKEMLPRFQEVAAFIHPMSIINKREELETMHKLNSEQIISNDID